MSCHVIGYELVNFYSGRELNFQTFDILFWVGRWLQKKNEYLIDPLISGEW